MFKLMNNIVISIILLLFIFLIIWSIFIEPNQIEIKYYEIQDSQLKGTRIVFAGDFHFKKHQQKRADKIISLINQQNADLVLSTGDYINSHKESASMSVSQIAENIGNIRPKVYTSLGNHDFWAGNEKITTEFKKHNITVLSNSNAKIKIKDKIIYIAGVEDLQTGNPDVEKALDDILQSYEKDKLNERKMEILDNLENITEENQKRELEKELSNIIIKLAKIR